MRVGIVGAGFIGSAFGNYLLGRGSQVTLLSRGHSALTQLSHPRLDFHKVVVAPGVRLADQLAGLDVLVDASSAAKPSNVDSSNVKQWQAETEWLAAESVRAGVGKFVFLSSGGTVYGDNDRFPTEKAPLNASTAYGQLKLQTEVFLENYCDQHDMQLVALRVANVYGPGQSGRADQGLVAHLLNSALDGETAVLYGDETVTRDYLYIDDLLAFLELVVTRPVHGIFNVGTGSAVALPEVARTVASVTNGRLQYVFKARRSFDLQSSTMNVDRAKAFGWAARVSLTQGVDHTWRALLAVREERLRQ